MTASNDKMHQTELNGDESPEAISLEPGEAFVLTPDVLRVANRAASYLNAGYPVHLCGPAGTGKTTLALHIAATRGRSVMLIHGDDEFSSSDLVGSEYGYRKSKLVDNFIHSVVKTEESMSTLWSDNRLTQACKNGDTLVYDEFTRSRPEANNALLAVLEEKLLNLPKRRHQGESFMEVHPSFRALFTSNPEEYAGVHRTQDALMDRLITIKLDYASRETEIQIIRAKSGVSHAEAVTIADIVRGLRSSGLVKQGPSMRAGIMIARVCSLQGARALADDACFRDVCQDILAGPLAKSGGSGLPDVSGKVDDLIAAAGRSAAPRETPAAEKPAVEKPAPAKPTKKQRVSMPAVALNGVGS